MAKLVKQPLSVLSWRVRALQITCFTSCKVFVIWLIRGMRILLTVVVSFVCTFSRSVVPPTRPPSTTRRTSF